MFWIVEPGEVIGEIIRKARESNKSNIKLRPEDFTWYIDEDDYIIIKYGKKSRTHQEVGGLLDILMSAFSPEPEMYVKYYNGKLTTRWAIVIDISGLSDEEVERLKYDLGQNADSIGGYGDVWDYTYDVDEVELNGRTYRWIQRVYLNLDEMFLFYDEYLNPLD